MSKQSNWHLLALLPIVLIVGGAIALFLRSPVDPPPKPEPGLIQGKTPEEWIRLAADAKPQSKERDGALQALRSASTLTMKKLAEQLRSENTDSARNAALVCQLLGGEASEVVGDLIWATKHKDDIVRYRVARVLGDVKFRPEETVPVLLKLLERDPDLFVRVEAARSLGQFGEAAAPAVSALQLQLNSSNGELQVNSATALAQINQKFGALPVALVSCWGYGFGKDHVVSCLGLPEKASPGEHLAALQDAPPARRASACIAMRYQERLSPEQTLALRKTLLEDKDELVQLLSAGSLGIHSKEDMPATLRIVRPKLGDASAVIRLIAVSNMPVHRNEPTYGPEVAAILLPLLQDKDRSVRVETVWQFRRLGVHGLDGLKAALKDNHPFVRETAAAGLGAVAVAEPVLSVETVRYLLKHDAVEGLNATDKMKDSFQLLEPDLLRLLEPEPKTWSSANYCAAQLLLQRGSLESAHTAARGIIAHLHTDYDPDAPWSSIFPSGLTVKRIPPQDLLNAHAEKAVSAMLERIAAEEEDPNQSPEPTVAPKIREILATLKPTPALHLEKALKTATTSQVRLAIVRELWRVAPPSPTVLPALRTVLSGAESKRRCEAAGLIGRLGAAGKDAIPELLVRLKDLEDGDGRAAASKALVQIGEAAVPEVTKLLGHQEPQIVCVSSETLGKMGPAAAKAAPELARLLGDGDSVVRRTAVVALGRLGPTAIQTLPALRKAATADKSADVRKAAAEAIKAISETK